MTASRKRKTSAADAAAPRKPLRRAAPKSNPSDRGSYPLSKFLAPAELLAGVHEIADLAKHQGVRVVLVGGFAMQHYGSDRLTGDLDFAASAVPTGLPAVAQLTFGGVRSATSAGIPTDFIVRDDLFQPLYEDVVALSPVAKSLGVRVATPEHLVAMKMVSGRGKDTEDLKFLLATEGLVDSRKARKIILRHLGPYAVQEFERVVEEVAWEKATGRR